MPGTPSRASARAGSPTTWRGCARRSTSQTAHGLRELTGTAAVAAWESPEAGDTRERLERLSGRGVLDAAGFLLHAPEDAALALAPDRGHVGGRVDQAVEGGWSRRRPSVGGSQARAVDEGVGSDGLEWPEVFLDQRRLHG